MGYTSSASPIFLVHSTLDCLELKNHSISTFMCLHYVLDPTSVVKDAIIQCNYYCIACVVQASLICCSGLASYSAMGFSLDGSSSESDSEDLAEGENDLEAGCTTEDGKLVLDRDVLDKLGDEDFAVEDFSHKLKKAMKLEGEAEALRFKTTKYVVAISCSDVCAQQDFLS